jgi:NodT family efflux transporter outer membrane factor (OMF) lipoprotein
MIKSFFLMLLTSMVFFAGCKTFEPAGDQPLPLMIPGSFSTQTDGLEPAESWWLSFDSDELNGLIREALDNNFDLNAFKTKIAQAKASVSKENAALFPALGFSVGGQKSGTQIKNAAGSSTYVDSHSWNGSLSGSYTLDVWGKANAGIESGMSILKAAELDLRAYTLELTVQVAETWIDIIVARNKKSILDHQIKNNQILLELQKLRFTHGKANALDVSQQREVLASASSQVPLLEKQEQLSLNSLAFLSGKTMAEQIQMNTKILPDPAPLPGVGIPSDLLENRPDIQAAKMRLSSAQWEITAARADLLPSFSLTAQALFSSGTLDLLFNNWIATLAGSIAGPIFDGGFRKAEVERVKAVAQEQINRYARTVAKAIQEVEDSLVSIEKQKDYIRLLEEELDVARLTLKDAMVQYQNGQSTYLAYLVAWTSIQRLERQLVGERAGYIKERIGLYRALGWMPAPEMK